MIGARECSHDHVHQTWQRDEAGLHPDTRQSRSKRCHDGRDVERKSRRGLPYDNVGQ